MTKFVTDMTRYDLSANFDIMTKYGIIKSFDNVTKYDIIKSFDSWQNMAKATILTNVASLVRRINSADICDRRYKCY